MARSLSVVLAGHPPSANEMRRMTPFERSHALSQWKQDVWYAIHAFAPQERPKHLRRARLTATFHYQKRRRRDFDNLVASLKGMIDGFVAASVLEDDTVDDIAGIDVVVVVDREHPETTELSVVEWPML